jgi:hypothetical protein
MKRFVLFASLFLSVLLASAYQILANPEILKINVAKPTASPSQVWTFESEFDIPRHVIQNYYEAINEGNYKFAYLLWDLGGSASGRDLETFRRRFQQTQEATVVFSSTGEMGEAEGFRYFKQPVTITTTNKAGEVKTFNGEYTLRQPVKNKVSETWHIYNVSYQQTGSSSEGFF